MKASLNWIREHVDTQDLSIDEIGEILTDIGLEVEGQERVEKIKGGLRGVVTGRVVTCERHPNADRLSVTTVDVGGEEDLKIVCGAPNVAAGQKVLVATIGTTLYSEEGEAWKIKKGKIRGEVSEGMICAEDELGLGSSHEGIMVLDEEVEVGINASEIFNLEEDVVYEIGLTPNRSDATGHIGIAKDLWAYLRINQQINAPVILKDLSSFQVDNESLSIPVEIKDTFRCPRYSCLTISEIKIAPSPEWLQFRLKAIGVSPINNVVDITNFILHEYGQPLHAFDADKIKGGKVIVQTLDEGTPFVTLDGVERKLSAEDLMICDAQGQPMCIGGVFGGMDTGVTDNTTRILLESAHFNAKSIRRTSMRHLLRTDAAMCYEKGSDPNVTIRALKHAALMMQELAGGKVTSKLQDIYPEPISKAEIFVRLSKVKQLIGADITKEDVADIIQALEMEVVREDETGWLLAIPTNKADVTREVDVLEEILRIYGFNKVPMSEKLYSVINANNAGSGPVLKRAITAFLADRGFNEMMGLSLSSSELCLEALEVPKSQMVFINNTSNVGLDVMRPDMLVSGLESVRHNINRRQVDLKLFEWGKSYLKGEEDYIETEMLTVFVTGQYRGESWREKNERTADFYDLKAIVSDLISRMGIQSFQQTALEDGRFDYGLRVHRGPNTVCVYGKLSDELCEKLNIRGEVFAAEFQWKEVEKATSKHKIIFSEISKYPGMRRDLALLIDEEVKYESVRAIIQKACGKSLKEVDIFDVYNDPKYLPEGKKSYAIKLVFEDLSKTLKDKEVDKWVQKALYNLEKELGAVLR